jgi:hypothetical protein
LRSPNFFNDASNSKESAGSNKPFFTVKDGNAADLLEWLQKEVAFRESLHEPVFSDFFRNLQAYKGAFHKKPGKQTDSNEVAPVNKFTSKYFVNHLYELTENFVSRMTRVKPGLEVLPSNDEYADKLSAKAVDLLVKHLLYSNDLDGLLIKAQRQRLIFGETFAHVKWNPQLGDLSPEFIEKRDNNKDTSDVPVRIGDVEVKLELPWNILLDNKTDIADCQSLILKRLVHIEELKQEYPDKKKALTVQKSDKFFNVETLEKDLCGDMMWEYTFFHKQDNNFPSGRVIKFTHNVLLSDEELTSYGEGFPIIRLTDLDVPGSLHGMSRYNQVLSLQNAHNNLSQSILKNEFLLAAPKWVMPKGSCKIDQLGNGRTVLQYQGPVPPQLVQMNPTSPTTINLREMLTQEMSTIFGVHQVSRGAPPQGITAAVALQFLHEQEVERSVSDITKHNNFIVELSKKMISIAAINYKPEDGRVLRIFGKNNKHMLFYFDAANLHKDYDIRVQLSSALPQSKAARMERILQTMQYAPDMLPPEKWVELLEFGSTEKMYTLVTEAINAAESEEEDLLAGIPVDEPQPWEDHITHLQCHYKRMQARSFKEETSPEMRELFIEHVTTTEMLASFQAEKNPLFAAKLAQLPQFPMFFNAPVPMSAEHQQAVVQGQANQGLPVSGAIPATEIMEPKNIR